MLSLRSRIFIIISLAVLIILGLSLFFVFLGQKKNAPAPENTGEDAAVPAANSVVLPTGQTVVVNPVAQGLTPQVPTALENEQNSARQLARIFIERYNSYSSASNFENLLEVKDLATPALWAKISGPLTKPPAASNGFIGVTTLAVATDLADWKDVSATVNIKTHITEDKGGAVTSRLAEVAIYLVKSNGNWLVDKFVWGK